ncbi:MAG: hypothetical protein K6F69_08400, partial [Treponema sp.]|nr:hypothetical protein [Treponema sp.]
MRFNTNNLFYSSKISKAFAFIAVITFLNVFATAKTSFNDNLDAENRRKMGNGEVIILNTGNTKKICLDTDNPVANKLIKTMKDLKPAYFSEVIQIKPYRGNEDLIERIEKELLDVPGYAGIPYYSVRHDKWYKLYESAEIKNKSSSGNKTDMLADVVMKP